MNATLVLLLASLAATAQGFYMVMWHECDGEKENHVPGTNSTLVVDVRNWLGGGLLQEEGRLRKFGGSCEFAYTPCYYAPGEGYQTLAVTQNCAEGAPHIDGLGVFGNYESRREPVRLACALPTCLL